MLLSKISFLYESFKALYNSIIKKTTSNIKPKKSIRKPFVPILKGSFKVV